MDNPDIVFIDLDHTLTDTDCMPAWKNMLAGMRLVSDSQRALLRNWLGANIKLHCLHFNNYEELPFERVRAQTIR